MTCVVRDARPEEADLLTEIARLAKASWGYPAEWLREWRPQLSLGAAYIRDTCVRVAEVRGTVVAVGALDEPPGPSVDRTLPLLRIDTTATLPGTAS